MARLESRAHFGYLTLGRYISKATGFQWLSAVLSGMLLRGVGGRLGETWGKLACVGVESRGISRSSFGILGGLPGVSPKLRRALCVFPGFSGDSRRNPGDLSGVQCVFSAVPGMLSGSQGMFSADP